MNTMTSRLKTRLIIHLAVTAQFKIQHHSVVGAREFLSIFSISIHPASASSTGYSPPPIPPAHLRISHQEKQAVILSTPGVDHWSSACSCLTISQLLLGPLSPLLVTPSSFMGFVCPLLVLLLLQELITC